MGTRRAGNPLNDVRTGLRRLAVRAYRLAMGPANDFDPARAWRGTGENRAPTLGVLHVGDCGFREMNLSHDLRGPVGYPKVAAERLAEHGVGLRFNHYFAVIFEQLPAMEALVRHSKLAEDPDVILVHLGGTYHRRMILGTSRRMQQFRHELGMRIGKHAFRYFRSIQPLVRVFGRYKTAYNGPEDLDCFLGMVRAAWPKAEVLVVRPFDNIFQHPGMRQITARVNADIDATAERCGAAVLNFNELLGRDPALRGANGYNLNARGSRLVGDRIGGGLLALAGRRMVEQPLRLPNGHPVEPARQPVDSAG
jgi:hypothetical protein